MTISRFLLACLVAPIFQLCFAEPNTQSMSDMSGMTVRVGCKTASSFPEGSGFFIGDSGRYVATNAHILYKCTETPIILSATKGGAPHLSKARILWSSFDNQNRPKVDLAVLELGSPLPVRGATFAGSLTVAAGDSVWAAGFPGAADKLVSNDFVAIPTLTAGKISRVIMGNTVDNSGIGTRLLQISAALNPGNSGGPLFNEFGEVVGINTSKSMVASVVFNPLMEGQVGIARVADGEAIGWAQQAEELLPILNSLNIKYSVRSEPRSSLAAWYYREPITAAALFIVMLSGLAVFWMVALRSLNIRDLRLKSFFARNAAATGGALIGLSGQYRGQSIPLSGTLVIGRDPSRCNIVIAGSNSDVSGVHCSITFDRSVNRFEVKDLGSTNGTHALGRKLAAGERVMLQAGDKFHIGQSGNRFEVILS